MKEPPVAVVLPVNVIDGVIGGAVISHAVGSPALGATTAVHAATAVLASGGPQVITTGITSPAVPRNVTATAGGTAGDIKAVQVTVTGTNMAGAVITETLPAFTVDTAGTVIGSKAFATVTGYSVPAMDGTGATVAIGTGAKLGIPAMNARNTVIAAYLAGTKEGTAPTVAVSGTAMESNTVTLDSALNGTAVVVDFYLS
jgi:hypothetical protein